MNELPFKQLKVLPKVKEFVPDLRKKIIDGEVNPLEVEVFLKKVGKIAEELVKGEEGKKIKELIIEEIHKNQEKNTSKVYGATIRESGRRFYDYSVCGDIVWEELNKIEKKVKELKKKREEELKLKVPSTKLDPSKDDFGLGVANVNIGVSYFPKLVLEPTNDLLDIQPPTEGSRTIFSYFL